MSHDSLTIRLTGVAPLLMRNGRLSDPLDPQTAELDRFTRKRAKSASDHAQIARIEWMAGLWLDAGAPCIPSEAIEACILQAARRRRAGPAVRAGVVCPSHARLDFDGPRSVDDLFQDARFVLRVPVQIQGRRTMRTRARFPTWRVEARIEFLPALFGRQELLDDLVIAGGQVGLGDWRPRFGRFVTEVVS